MPTTKRKKRDLVRAEKPVGETTDEVSTFSSLVLRSSVKLLLFQFKSNQCRCMNYAKIQAFSDTCFPVYGQNRIRIFASMYRIYDIRENTDMILSIYGKIRTREYHYFVA